MRVKIHKLFEIFLQAQAAQPRLSMVHSLAEPPCLGDFLDALDPDLKLDWSAQSFQGLPSLREKVVLRWGYAPVCVADDVLITAGTAKTPRSTGWKRKWQNILLSKPAFFCPRRPWPDKLPFACGAVLATWC